MSAFYINANGVEHVTTTVTIPRELHAWARESGVSLSGTLRVALESKQQEYGRGTATNEDPSRNPDTYAMEASR